MGAAICKFCSWVFCQKFRILSLVIQSTDLCKKNVATGRNAFLEITLHSLTLHTKIYVIQIYNANYMTTTIHYTQHTTHSKLPTSTHSYNKAYDTDSNKQEACCKKDRTQWLDVNCRGQSSELYMANPTLTAIQCTYSSNTHTVGSICVNSMVGATHFSKGHAIMFVWPCSILILVVWQHRALHTAHHVLH